MSNLQNIQDDDDNFFYENDDTPPNLLNQDDDSFFYQEEQQQQQDVAVKWGASRNNKFQKHAVGSQKFDIKGIGLDDEEAGDGFDERVLHKIVKGGRDVQIQVRGRANTNDFNLSSPSQLKEKDRYLRVESLVEPKNKQIMSPGKLGEEHSARAKHVRKQSSLMIKLNKRLFRKDESQRSYGLQQGRSPGMRYSQSRSKFSSFVSNTASVVSKVSSVVNIEPGSLSGSIFSLIAACMGAGTLTMPYIVSKTGIVLGPLLIIIGAFLSYYAGMLIIKCSQMTGKQTYEEFAYISYGKKFSQIVAIFILISLLGFAVAYVALAKTLIPTALESSFGKENLPEYVRDTKLGRFVDVTIFTFCIFLPMSTPQELSALRFSSALGVVCTVILVFVVVYQFLCNDFLVKNKFQNLEHAVKFNCEFMNIVEAVPYVTFLYLFQPNVPQTYLELKGDTDTVNSQLMAGSDKGLKSIIDRLMTMDKVLFRSSFYSSLVYIVVGIFGYLTFAENHEQTFEQLQSPDRSKDILEADYVQENSVGQEIPYSIQISQLFIMLAVICASPLAILPAKHSYWSLVKSRPKQEMTSYQNKKITLCMIIGCYVLAILIPDIGTVISIAGATVNPFIGFLFPIIFYLKIEKDYFNKNKGHLEYTEFSRMMDRSFSYMVAFFISAISIAGFFDIIFQLLGLKSKLKQ